MTTPPTPWPWSRPSEQPTVRLRDPAGVVAAVPYLLGFVPRRSLVVVGIHDDQGVGPTLRTDLATDELLAVGPHPLLSAAWEHACQVLRRNGCPTALVVLYADAEPADLPDGVAEQVVGTLEACPDRDPGGTGRRLDVLDVLLVGPTRFRSFSCLDRACCPAAGEPVVTTASHPVAVTFVLAGRSPAPARDAVEPVPQAASPRDRAAAAAAALGSPRAGTGPDRPTAAADLLEAWLRALPEGPAPALAGRLAAGWRASPLLRDACLAAFLPGGPSLSRRMIGAQPDGTPAGGRRRGAGESLAGSLADPGCSGAVRGGAPVLRRMAALVPGPERADVVAAHAWLAWASGEGTAATLLAERALEVDPGQSLARLVLQCLEHGLGAPWTLRPRAAGARAGLPGPR